MYQHYCEFKQLPYNKRQKENFMHDGVNEVRPVKGRSLRLRSFTLIELLVVVAIISVLVSLLLPSLNEARRMAKRATCASQLKQIGIGIEMYMNEYNDYVPVRNPAGWDSPTFWMVDGSGHYNFLGHLYKAKYLLDHKLYYCPDTQLGTLAEAFGLTQFDHYNFNLGIVLSSSYAMRFSWMSSYYKRDQAESIYGKSDIGLVACSRWTPDDPTYYFDSRYYMDPHKGMNGVNVFYMDGGVSWVKDSFPYNNLSWESTATGWKTFWWNADRHH